MEGFAFYMPVEVESGRHSIHIMCVERCLKWRVRPFVEAIPKQLGVERAVMCQPPFGGSGITAQPRLLPVVVSTSAPSEINEDCVHTPGDFFVSFETRDTPGDIYAPFFSGLVLKSGETTR